MIRMIRAFILSLFVALTCSHGLAGETPAAPTLHGVITWVYDGDTLEIKPVGKVRLIGIDTPERTASGRDRYLLSQGVAEPRLRQVYRAAKQFNINQMKGQQVRLGLDGPARDRYDRLLAYVYLADGRLLNRLLLEEGLAVVYRRFDFRLKDDFLAAEAAARERQLGLWAPQ